MNYNEVLELIDVVSNSKLAEFNFEEGNLKLNLKNPSAYVCSNVQTQTVIDSQATSTATVSNRTTNAVLDEPKAVKSIDNSDITNNDEEISKENKKEGQIMSSPLLGTFYSAPSEDAESFVKIGDVVKKGQILGIVEAMKLMNEIESEFDGEITEILVENGQMVEYGQPLFRIKK